mmetsp:Transcript_28720/g.32830  ORF Transcript_28720/g.32830 Transcript_28720/m.32830 type:complete len:86 (+) Transcript_28720:65-322(+)
MHIFARTITGNCYTLEVDTDTKIIDLMLMIARQSHLEAFPTLLIFAGRPLDENKVVGDYGISKESTIHIITPCATFCRSLPSKGF